MPVVDDFCVPFTAHIHPRPGSAHGPHLDWLIRRGLLPSQAAPAYEGWKLTEFAACTYPWASDPDLKTACDLYGWWALFDDQFDGSQGLTLSETRAKCARITAVMNGAAPDAADPFAMSFAELWAALTDGMSPYWIQRHRRHWNNYLGGYPWEHALRDTGRTPPLQEYLEQRRWNVVTDPCYDLIERFSRAELPQPAAGDARFDALHMLATHVIVIVNDTFSFEKEDEAGDAHYNLLSVLRRHQHLTPAQAVTRAKRLLAETVEDYLDVERAYLSSWWHAGLAGEQMAALETLTVGLRVWMRGNIDWHLSTHRYDHVAHAA